jgi:hypothetical protein
MKVALVLLAILVIATPALAGTWDANKDWVCLVQSEVKTLSQFGWKLDGTNPIQAWGPQMERTGAKKALRCENNAAGNSQNKYRSDSAPAGWTFDTTMKTAIKIGFYSIDSTSSHPQIYIRQGGTGATSAKIRYDDVLDAWAPARPEMLFGSGSPTSLATPQGAWHTVRLQLNGTAWDVWLDGDVNKHMWGTTSGDTGGNYVQFGCLGNTTDTSKFAVDRVVWGQGDDHIAPLSDDAIPEPGSIIALATGLVALAGLARRRR